MPYDSDPVVAQAPAATAPPTAPWASDPVIGSGGNLPAWTRDPVVGPQAAPHQGFVEGLIRKGESFVAGALPQAASALKGAAGIGDALAQAEFAEGGASGQITDPFGGNTVLVPQSQRAPMSQIATQRTPMAVPAVAPTTAAITATGKAITPPNQTQVEKDFGIAGGFGAAILTGPLAPAVFASSAFSDAHDEAVAKGADEASAQQAGLENAAAQGVITMVPFGKGLTKIVGKVGGKMVEQVLSDKARGVVSGVAKTAVEHAGGGAAMNAAMTSAGNIVAQQNYDPARPWLQDVPQAAVVGAIGGAGAHVVGTGVRAGYNLAKNAIAPKTAPEAPPASPGAAPEPGQPGAPAAPEPPPSGLPPTEEPYIQPRAAVSPTHFGSGLVQSAIVQASQAHPGLDPVIPLTVADIESNFSAAANPKSPQRQGVFQLGDKEWAAQGGTAANRGDINAQIALGVAHVAQEDAALAARIGRPPTVQEVYLAHQQGVGGALALRFAPEGETAVGALEAAGVKPKVALASIEGNLPAELKGQAGTITAAQFVGHWDGEVARRTGSPVPATAGSPQGLGPSGAPQEPETAPQAPSEPEIIGSPAVAQVAGAINRRQARWQDPTPDQTALAAQDHGADPALMGDALADAKEWSKAPPGNGPSLFTAIRDLGGIRTIDQRDGRPEDVGAILDRFRMPGLVNNRKPGDMVVIQTPDGPQRVPAKLGLTPDAMREALQDAGWFGRADTSRTEAGQSYGDNFQTSTISWTEVRARVSGIGNLVRHPDDSASQLAIDRWTDLDDQMQRAGVELTDAPAVKAAKLAAWRTAEQKRTEAAMILLRPAADGAGVEPAAGQTFPEHLADVLQARHAEERPGEESDEHEGLIDAELTPEEHEWLTAAERGPRGEQGRLKRLTALSKGSRGWPPGGARW